MGKSPKRIRPDHSCSKRDQDSNPITRNFLTPVSSTSLKSVYLHNWWLVSLDGKRIAVGGLVTGEELEEMGFQSKAIVKRCNTVTLEAEDGIVVILSGFINKNRTLQNGFSSQICAQFMLGFPYSWEQYVTQYHNGESASSDVNPGRKTFHQISLNNLPVTMISCQLMYPLGDCDNHVLDHMLEASCNSILKHSEPQNRSPSTTTKEGTSRRGHKKGEPKEKHKNFDELPEPTDEGMTVFTTPSRHIVASGSTTSRQRGRVNLSSQSTIVRKMATATNSVAYIKTQEFDAPSVGVVTRSMSRRMQQRNTCSRNQDCLF